VEAAVLKVVLDPGLADPGDGPVEDIELRWSARPNSSSRRSIRCPSWEQPVPVTVAQANGSAAS
jgi:hypothetical protein